MHPHRDPFTEGGGIVALVIAQAEYLASSSTARNYMYEVGVVVLIPEIEGLIWCFSSKQFWPVGWPIQDEAMDASW